MNKKVKDDETDPYLIKYTKYTVVSFNKALNDLSYFKKKLTTYHNYELNRIGILYASWRLDVTAYNIFRYTEILYLTPKQLIDVNYQFKYVTTLIVLNIIWIINYQSIMYPVLKQCKKLKDIMNKKEKAIPYFIDEQYSDHSLIHDNYYDELCCINDWKQILILIILIFNILNIITLAGPMMYKIKKDKDVEKKEKEKAKLEEANKEKEKEANKKFNENSQVANPNDPNYSKFNDKRKENLEKEKLKKEKEEKEKEETFITSKVRFNYIITAFLMLYITPNPELMNNYHMIYSMRKLLIILMIFIPFMGYDYKYFVEYYWKVLTPANEEESSETKDANKNLAGYTVYDPLQKIQEKGFYIRWLAKMLYQKEHLVYIILWCNSISYLESIMMIKDVINKITNWKLMVFFLIQIYIQIEVEYKIYGLLTTFEFEKYIVLINQKMHNLLVTHIVIIALDSYFKDDLNIEKVDINHLEEYFEERPKMESTTILMDMLPKLITDKYSY